MNLTAEQIQDNWGELMGVIDESISSPRKEKLLEFYNQYAERLMLMPAAHKKEALCRLLAANNDFYGFKYITINDKLARYFILD